MRAILFVGICLVATTLMSQVENAAIIPVAKWPTTIQLPNKLVTGASVSDCVKAGYRFQLAMPATPTGKRIVKTEWVQDDKTAEFCKAIVTYDDIPAPPVVPPYVPPVLTNVAASRVQYQFTTNGMYYSIKWLDAPASNVTERTE